ncbi:MAG: hypothetical protein QOG97_1128 [Acidimicrobiaceae bacterium]|nr:hypothetical protein [Acidimicrobiaceae bacterium]
MSQATRSLSVLARIHFKLTREGIARSHRVAAAASMALGQPRPIDGSGTVDEEPWWPDDLPPSRVTLTCGTMVL